MEYKFENNKIEFIKKDIEYRLNLRYSYFKLILLIVLAIIAIININNNMSYKEFLFWPFMIFFTIYIYMMIAGFYKKSIDEAIFDDINIILTIEWKESEIFITYYNTLSLIEENIIIKKEDFEMYSLFKPLDYKIIHNGIDIYFPFSSFATEYVFKKYFDFKVPIIEIDEPKKKKRFFFF